MNAAHARKRFSFCENIWMKKQVPNDCFWLWFSHVMRMSQGFHIMTDRPFLNFYTHFFRSRSMFPNFFSHCKETHHPWRLWTMDVTSSPRRTTSTAINEKLIICVSSTKRCSTNEMQIMKTTILEKTQGKVSTLATWVAVALSSQMRSQHQSKSFELSKQQP